MDHVIATRPDGSTSDRLLRGLVMDLRLEHGVVEGEAVTPVPDSDHTVGRQARIRHITAWEEDR